MTIWRPVLWLSLLASACTTDYQVGGKTTGASTTEGETEGCTPCGEDCVDLRTNDDHCGACGNGCESEESCREGACQPECDPGCDETREVCADGACACRTGFSSCGDLCVDLQRDRDHCGSCDNQCPEACGDSLCQDASCTGFAAACGSSCTDLETDPLNCGACGESCEPDQICQSGTCSESAAPDRGRPTGR